MNPFVGWSISELEAALRRAQEELASGKNTVRVASGDVSRQSEVALSPQMRIAYICAAIKAQDPDHFAADITLNSVTRVAFNSFNDDAPTSV